VSAKNLAYNKESFGPESAPKRRQSAMSRTRTRPTAVQVRMFTWGGREGGREGGVRSCVFQTRIRLKEEEERHEQDEDEADGGPG